MHVHVCAYAVCAFYRGSVYTGGGGARPTKSGHLQSARQHWSAQSTYRRNQQGSVITILEQINQSMYFMSFV